jgi:hypothetical protein
MDIADAEPGGRPFAAAVRGGGQILDRIQRQSRLRAQSGQALSLGADRLLDHRCIIGEAKREVEQDLACACYRVRRGTLPAPATASGSDRRTPSRRLLVLVHSAGGRKQVAVWARRGPLVRCRHPRTRAGGQRAAGEGSPEAGGGPSPPEELACQEETGDETSAPSVGKRSWKGVLGPAALSRGRQLRAATYCRGRGRPDPPGFEPDPPGGRGGSLGRLSPMCSDAEARHSGGASIAPGILPSAHAGSPGLAPLAHRAQTDALERHWYYPLPAEIMR